MSLVRSADRDLIDAIGNNLALVSHLVELYLNPDYKGQRDEIWSTIITTTDTRRQMLDKLVPDDKSRCPVKHAILAYVAMEEVWLADTAREGMSDLLELQYNVLRKVIKTFCGIELEFCSRCLEDKIEAELAEIEDF
jgi:hypothetical protein